ncbi:uncharacterized protein PHACADRAFT_201084 [Phanerochaete carnosa HHB-10118-sp]|uniref:Uncharacterized protein n=1 Tax=Phanerochaete carnosa (strain HHB-10118-sp) TaxID=650164 RepID=K5VUI1_PHACS|nr:uncharacterized protein PHACADRAFT_201084 [Phanerochaete carnosa HHB-10118-sp]EKM50244.1 hypothetical protein PHACADRAFT_201084 [Phanerochaete carnosa HHB-10118-sp]
MPVFSALRVFAIWDRSRVWSIVVFALSMVAFVTNIYDAAVTKYGFFTDPLVGKTCINDPLFSAQQTDRVMISTFLVYTTRASLILADIIMIVLTWIKTFGQWRETRRLNMKVPLTRCLLRDGTIYFMALLAINITQILTYNFSTNISLVGTLKTTLPSVLINRFIINLRAAGSEPPDHSLRISDQQQGQSIPQLRRHTDRLGNIVGTLQDVWGDEPCDEDADAAVVGGEGHHEIGAEA